MKEIVVRRRKQNRTASEVSFFRTDGQSKKLTGWSERIERRSNPVPHLISRSANSFACNESATKPFGLITFFEISPSDAF
jgi:hypothetical protein